MLSRKQSVRDNLEWLRAYEECTSVHSQGSIQELEKRTIESFTSALSRYSNPCNGWIAGKDSIALQLLVRRSGVPCTPIMWRGINEYPAMRDWIDENKPNGIVESVIDKFTLGFLESHPKYLFCKGDTRNRWMAEKWKRQKSDMSKYGFDVMVLGRRIKDGNQCGRRSDGFIAKKNGYDVYSPMAEWTHEQLLAYLRYNDIELPPFYWWPRGFLIGSIAMGEWTERAGFGMSDKEVWQEIWQIDSSIVISAANKGLSSAENYLEEKDADC